MLDSVVRQAIDRILSRRQEEGEKAWTRYERKRAPAQIAGILQSYLEELALSREEFSEGDFFAIGQAARIVSGRLEDAVKRLLAAWAPGASFVEQQFLDEARRIADEGVRQVEAVLPAEQARIFRDLAQEHPFRCESHEEEGNVSFLVGGGWLRPGNLMERER